MKLIKNINLASLGYLRVAAATLKVSPANVNFNTESIISAIDAAAAKGASVLVLPELCVTGYTCADLFNQRLLISGAYDALQKICEYTTSKPGLMVALGMPVSNGDLLYNCAVIVSEGSVRGVVPKRFLPNYNEFYEKRWFASAPAFLGTVHLCGMDVPFGTNLLFELGGVKIGVELCEDLWAPMPPGVRAALSGAEIILNLSASNEVIGKHDYLLSLIKHQSASLICGYVYASAGRGESSTDLVFAGNAIIAENGKLMATSKRFSTQREMEFADIDVALLRHDRRHSSTWRDSVKLYASEYKIISIPFNDTNSAELYRSIDATPFVPSDISRRDERCSEIISIQSAALQRRLEATGCKKLVIGVSGGLDSTLALLVAHHAFKMLGLPLEGIVGITMPGFGTTGRTYNNATSLVKSLGATLEEINIAAVVRQHFTDIGHDEKTHDVTYENAQARERTQILMDYANKVGGMVLGTGDLSELALGWCTYNADHMSMYGINASVPKTLVKYLVKYFADNMADESLGSVLCDIIDTPISPELLPANEAGDINQKTENLVGPYKLHDFVLYHVLRYGFEPAKIYTLACSTFSQEFSPEVILGWMKVFYKRFFNQQFKRSCMPDGPKVGSVCLSPRGDWRMPSDASSSLWLAACEAI